MSFKSLAVVVTAAALAAVQPVLAICPSGQMAVGREWVNLLSRLHSVSNLALAARLLGLHVHGPRGRLHRVLGLPHGERLRHHRAERAHAGQEPDVQRRLLWRRERLLRRQPQPDRRHRHTGQQVVVLHAQRERLHRLELRAPGVLHARLAGTRGAGDTGGVSAPPVATSNK
ncbi:hypothetical protein PHLGIDRAFT_407883 [Phlebiopsis gigantea 11061_1 CR5-6]|uniref:Uncharacterized protein n=1 Tax=Phlebiopsis gigantea (strain 11061_1 CR5-6) TaxID=745531 RepID=A0A0C3SB94_PHLG1|nr:hypothetical protein PHLGIDRAFT_407883 [Phlebiopsis gigantea 11061_1 CR5-6]